MSDLRVVSSSRPQVGRALSVFLIWSALVAMLAGALVVCAISRKARALGERSESEERGALGERRKRADEDEELSESEENEREDESADREDVLVGSSVGERWRTSAGTQSGALRTNQEDMLVGSLGERWRTSEGTENQI